MAKKQAITFKLNPKGIKKMNDAFDRAWGEVMAALDIELEATIRDPYAFADLGFVDQDIIDSGRFLKSQQIKDDGRAVAFSWSAKDPKSGFAYPLALYTGYRAWGRKYIPGRKWPEKAADSLDLVGYLKAKMRAYGVKGQVKVKKKLYN